MKWLGSTSNVLSAIAVIMSPFFLISHAYSETLWKPSFQRENERENIPVVGAYVAGAAYVSDQKSQKRPSLLARIPKHWAGSKVCARGTSVDGVYEGLFGYDVPKDWTGKSTVKLQYPTRFESRLSDARLDNFGLVLTVGDCEAQKKIITPVFWNSLESETVKAVQLMINSVGANEVYLFVGESADAPAIECTKLNVEIAKEFDYVCLVPIETFSDGRTRVEINTKFSGVGDPPLNIFIETRKTN